MGTETRVGIVAGLVIVVVASVYFFYGSTPGEDELLVATATRVTEPPTIPSIPATTDRSKNSGDAARTTGRVDRSAATRQETAEPVRREARRLEDRLAAGPRATVEQPVSAQGAGIEQTRGVPIVLADPSKSTAADRPIALRTSPSQELVEATWDNLVRGEDRGAGAQGSDYETIGDRIRSATTDDATGEASTTLIIPSRTSSPVAETGSDPMPRESSPTRTESRPPMLNVPDASTAGSGLSTSSGTRTIMPQRPLSGSSSSRWPKQHVIVEGDTLEAISQQYYETRTAASDILAANPHVKGPRQLRIGDTLTIPEPKTPAADSAPATADRASERRASAGGPSSASTTSRAERTYVVVGGDTLFGIAQKQLGSGARWDEILQLNKTLLKGDPKRLAPGMTLKLPD